MSSPGNRASTNDIGWGLSMEGNYHPVGGSLREFHLHLLDFDDVDNRIWSYTVAESDTNNWRFDQRISQAYYEWPKTATPWLYQAPGTVRLYTDPANASRYISMTVDGSNFGLHTSGTGNLYLNDASGIVVPGGSLTTGGWDVGVNIALSANHAYELRDGSNNNVILLYQNQAMFGDASTITWASSVDGLNAKDTGLARDSAGVVRVSNGSTGKGTLISAGNGSYGVGTVTTSATGATNTLGVNVVIYVTAATGASLTDNAGTTEFSGVTIAAFTPIRLQPGGAFVATGATYATGTASHAW